MASDSDNVTRLLLERQNEAELWYQKGVDLWTELQDQHALMGKRGNHAAKSRRQPFTSPFGRTAKEIALAAEAKRNEPCLAAVPTGLLTSRRTTGRVRKTIEPKVERLIANNCWPIPWPKAEEPTVAANAAHFRSFA